MLGFVPQPNLRLYMLPKTLSEAIEQGKEATKTALEVGCTRLQVELVYPEIALQAQAIAAEFAHYLTEYTLGLKVMFADTGAAALARRDWGEVPFQVTDLGSRLTNVDTKINDADKIFLIVCPAAVEVSKIEELCKLAGYRPVILLLPQLEDVSIVGIGYAARQLRDRFLSTLESCYYIRPIESGVLFRSYPQLWQVWLEKGEEWKLIAEEREKPVGDDLDFIIARATRGSQEEEGIPQRPKRGIFGNLGRLFKALNQ